MSFTRRDILVGLLGLPALAHCKVRTPQTIHSRFVFEEDMALAHRLRGNFAPKGAPSPESVDVVVVGAGVAGLSCAWKLMREGVRDVVVLELSETLGGTSSSTEGEPTAYPWAAHYLPVPSKSNPDLKGLMEEAGCLHKGEYREDFLCASPKERVYFRGAWYEGLLPSAAIFGEDRKQFDRFESIVQMWAKRIGKDGRRAFSLPVSTSSEDPRFVALDDLSMDEWLTREGFDSKLLRWYLEYATRDDFGSLLGNTSAWFGLHYFCARIADESSESSEFLTWPEGNGFWIKYFVKKVGAHRIRPRSLVTSVRSGERRAEVVGWNAQTGSPFLLHAKKVVVATPSHVRRRILDGPPAYQPDTCPWVVSNVHLKERPGSSGFEQAWDNVIFDSRSLGYVVATHQTGRVRGPTVWTHYLPMPDDDARASRAALFGLNHAEIAQTVVSELASSHLGFMGCLDRVDIRRWGHAMVRPCVGMLQDADRKAAHKPVGRIHFAHTDLSGVALFEEAFFHGVRAAEEVRLEFAKG